MLEAIKNIITKIAGKFGLELHQKSETEVDYSEGGLNLTAIGAASVSNITIDDSDIIVKGDNQRAEAIRSLADYYQNDIENVACEVALGTGDCIIRPYTMDNDIGLNIIGNDNFIITSAVGNKVKGVIMLLDEYETGNKTYRLFEMQTLKDGVCVIKRFAFVDEKEIAINNTNWAGIQEEAAISAEQLLIGRIKCPTIDRTNYNSANGVPITFGCENIIEEVQNKYQQYNEEFDRKRSRIFADRLLFKRDDKGGLTFTDDTEIVKLNGDYNGQINNAIYDYSPAIREADYKAGNDFNLAVLEMCCGFSRGIFTKPETAFATATEMKNSLKKTFAFVKRFRRRIEQGNNELFNAIDILMNVNGITPMGDWDISYQWSYDYIEETKEKFNQLLQAHSIGAVKTEEVRSWTLDIPLDQATEDIAEMNTDV
jgi:A118 family predicted phage portal protein